MDDEPPPSASFHPRLRNPSAPSATISNRFTMRPTPSTTASAPTASTTTKPLPSHVAWASRPCPLPTGDAMIKTTLSLFAFSALAFAVPIPQPGQPTHGLSQTQDLSTGAMTKDTADREQDPLKYIAKDMGTIVVDLDHLQTDKPVQTKQERVVSELDILIKKLEKSCSGSGGGSLNPSNPMTDSMLGGGPGGINDLHDPKAGEKEWGKLPDKQREQILQSKTDGFPPGYESIL